MLKESLIKLRSLVDNLEDRDKCIKQDHNLFAKFFENFPTAVSMWSINAEGKVLSCKGNDFLNDRAATYENLFTSEEVRKKVDKAMSIDGEVVELFLETEEKTYYTKILKRIEDEEQVGTMGMAWDVSSNITLLGSLVRIKDLVETGGDIEEIKKWAQNGIDASRMRILIERLTGNGG